MGISKQTAKHFKEVYFGGNWTGEASNLKDVLSDITWQEATKKVYELNTIATLVNHIHYYVRAVTVVLEGGDLNAKDELSFEHPPINNQKDWDNMVNALWGEAENFTSLIEKLPDDILERDFTDKKYGIYFRNLHGIIEHTHYHLGQIVVIKKIIRQ